MITESQLIEQLQASARKTRNWLLQLEFTDEEHEAYRDLGIMLAEGAIDEIMPLAGEFENQQHSLPDVPTLVMLDRSALIQLSRDFVGVSVDINQDSALAIAQLAMSFARQDDLQATVAMIRIQGQLPEQAEIEQEVWGYVFGQQQPNGAFGLLSAEVVLLNRAMDTVVPQLLMTVEVLWAIAVYVTVRMKEAV